MKIADIRMKAYKMSLDPDSAEKLANEVGIPDALAVLEKTARFLAHEASLPAHPKKKSPDWVFRVESTKCRRQFRAAKGMELQRQERLRTAEASKNALESGYQPKDKIREQLAKQFENDEITYKQYQSAIAFADDVYGKEIPDVSEQNTLAL